jgi:hypothetical protein
MVLCAPRMWHTGTSPHPLNERPHAHGPKRAPALVALVQGACASSSVALAPLQLTFLASRYRIAYGRTRCPEAYEADKVLAAVRVVVMEWARRHGLAEGATTVFLQQLYAEWALNEKIADMAQKVWTSVKVLDGREFCFMLNELVRNDALLDDDVADQVATLAHGINSNVVTRGVGGDVPWPHGPKGGPGHNSTLPNACFRGGGFSDTTVTRDFFVVGQKFRTAGFLATSYNKYVAENFIARVRSLPATFDRRSVTHARSMTHDDHMSRCFLFWGR